MSEVYWLSQAFDMIKRYVACVQAAFADPHLVRFEMTTNFGCALNAESIIDCLSQKKFYAIPSYQRAYKWDTEHVTRLLSEICRYYYDSTQKFQSCVGYDLTKHAKFIGTVILVRDEQLKKKIFETGDSEFYAVIDGQQRLTTCYLFYIALLNRLYYLSNKIAECIIDKITYTGNLRNVTDDINDCVKLIEPVLWRASRKLFKSTLNNRLHRNLACVIDKSSRGAKLERAFEELPQVNSSLDWAAKGLTTGGRIYLNRLLQFLHATSRSFQTTRKTFLSTTQVWRSGKQLSI